MQTVQQILDHELTVPALIISGWIGVSTYMYAATWLTVNL